MDVLLQEHMYICNVYGSSAHRHPFFPPPITQNLLLFSHYNSFVVCHLKLLVSQLDTTADAKYDVKSIAMHLWL